MKKLLYLNALLLLLFLCTSTSFASDYDANEIKQLVAFLNQPSSEAGKTNAAAIGITGTPTTANVSEWGKQLGLYIKTEGKTNYITHISLENKGNFKLGGSFVIENFKYLEQLHLYCMGSEVKVKSCPMLGDFRLMGKYGEEHCNERKLEITGCPILWKFRIECLVTEYTLTGSPALEQVNISHTRFSHIDFSTQTQLSWLILNNNAFSKIGLPEPGKWNLEIRYNQIEPADLVEIIRKMKGNDHYLDWRFIPVEYYPQQITYRDPATGSDLIPVGTKIDLRGKASFKYGDPEKTYTGTFKWQYKKPNNALIDIPATGSMTQGVYTIPNDMANQTIVVNYECESMIANDAIQYFINVVPK